MSWQLLEKRLLLQMVCPHQHITPQQTNTFLYKTLVIQIHPLILTHFITTTLLAVIAEEQLKKRKDAAAPPPVDPSARKRGNIKNRRNKVDKGLNPRGGASTDDNNDSNNDNG